MGPSCRNCGALPPEGAHYCPVCGQEMALHPPTFAEFVHEFIGHYIALEGALWRTLGLLLFKPGRLTREYLEGRRRKYVFPLRLYLTISFVFFIVAKLLVSPDVKPVAGAQPPASIKLPHVNDCGTPGYGDCTFIDRWLIDRAEAARRNPRAFAQNLDAKAVALAPYAMFLLLPVFAGIMQLVWRSRRMTYGEHFVFSLHLHSFWFLDLMASNVLLGSLGDVLVLLVPVYAIVAMRNVYGGSWLAAIARGIAGLALYGVALAATLAITLIIVISSLG